MLVLSRRLEESILIDREIRVRVLEVRGNRVRLGIEAPSHIPLVRSEIWVDPSEREELVSQTTAGWPQAPGAGHLPTPR